MNTSLPAGFCARPASLEDLEPMVAMFNAFSQAEMGSKLHNLEATRGEWVAPIMNLQENTMVVFTVEGRPAGYVEFWDTAEPHIAFFGWAAVHPEFYGRGIGSFLVDWLKNRAVKNVHLAPEGARVVLDCYTEAQNQDARALFTRSGFLDTRSSYWMRIDFSQPPQPPSHLPGITIRAINGAAEERAALEAAYEAFKDHWGHVDEPFESFYERQIYYTRHNPAHDPGVWFIALDGAEIAGVSLCQTYLEGTPEQGWVNTLGVRRPWRKRGVGLALLQHSFVELHRRGSTCAGLGVDASSLTGATRLYEKAGMRVVRRNTLYQLELRPGKDLRTNSVS